MAGIYRARVGKDVEREAQRFSSSIKDDLRIFQADILGTQAHEIMLHEIGVLSREELVAILGALEKVRGEIARRGLDGTEEYDDIHEYVESRVIRTLGIEVGGKMHTARSRNDQVALDIRLQLRNELLDLAEATVELVDSILRLAGGNVKTVMPLYTHTQQSQISSFAHLLLSYVEHLLRDLDRTFDSLARVNLCPLGASAIAGTRFPVDRNRVKELLGFDGILENSIDATSSRDHVIECASVLASIQALLSRIAEDMVLFTTTEFGYLELADQYASTSSVMPHKKNPDVLELIRGRTGRVNGNLIQLLTVMKGIPTGYSRDIQESKILIWPSFDIVRDSLRLLGGVFDTLLVKKEVMKEKALQSYASAVDLAEELAIQLKIPFRQAHQTVGRLVKNLVAESKAMSELKTVELEKRLEEGLGRKIGLKNFDLRSILDPSRLLEGRRSVGSPSPAEVRRMLADRRGLLDSYRSRVRERRNQIGGAETRLRRLVRSFLK